MICGYESVVMTYADAGSSRSALVYVQDDQGVWLEEPGMLSWSYDDRSCYQILVLQSETMDSVYYEVTSQHCKSDMKKLWSKMCHSSSRYTSWDTGSSTALSTSPLPYTLLPIFSPSRRHQVQQIDNSLHPFSITLPFLSSSRLNFLPQSRSSPSGDKSSLIYDTIRYHTNATNARSSQCIIYLIHTIQNSEPTWNKERYLTPLLDNKAPPENLQQKNEQMTSESLACNPRICMQKRAKLWELKHLDARR